MTPPTSPEASIHRIAMWIVGFLGLSQGAVPLVARGVFGRDEGLAVALRLPAPWWWIACVAIAIAAVVLVAVLDDGRQGQPSVETADAPPSTVSETTEGSGAYDALSGVVFLVGIYNGVAPFISRLVFDGDLLLALPLHLPAPWWWIISLTVLAVAAALLVLIDSAKNRAADE